MFGSAGKWSSKGFETDTPERAKEDAIPRVGTIAGLILKDLWDSRRTPNERKQERLQYRINTRAQALGDQLEGLGRFADDVPAQSTSWLDGENPEEDTRFQITKHGDAQFTIGVATFYDGSQGLAESVEFTFDEGYLIQATPQLTGGNQEPRLREDLSPEKTSRELLAVSRHLRNQRVAEQLSYFTPVEVAN